MCQERKANIFADRTKARLHTIIAQCERNMEYGNIQMVSTFFSSPNLLMMYLNGWVVDHFLQ